MLFFKKKKPKLELHGFDLDEWNYLGHSKITFFDMTKETEVKTEAEAFVFFFINKKDGTREYTIKTGFPNWAWSTHNWILQIADLWEINEYSTISNGLINCAPGRYLLDYAKNEHNLEYDYERNTWVPITTDPEEEQKDEPV
jgi:hypothetical protein